MHAVCAVLQNLTMVRGRVLFVVSVHACARERRKHCVCRAVEILSRMFGDPPPCVNASDLTRGLVVWFVNQNIRHHLLTRFVHQLDVTYSVNSIGMKYERMLFGMKISDAACLAKAIQATEIMASLVLQVWGAVAIAVVGKGGEGVLLYLSQSCLLYFTRQHIIRFKRHAVVCGQWGLVNRPTANKSPPHYVRISRDCSSTQQVEVRAEVDGTCRVDRRQDYASFSSSEMGEIPPVCCNYVPPLLFTTKLYLNEWTVLGC